MDKDRLRREYRRRGYWLPETLPQRFGRVCAENRDRVALVDGDRRLTFTDMETLVGRMAAHLTLLGVGPGDVVSWQLPNWWEAVVVHHATVRLGAVSNPLSATFRARELRFVLAEARPKVLFAPWSFRGFGHADLAVRLRKEIAGLEHVVSVRGGSPETLGSDALLGEASGGELPRLPGDPSAVALLLYTSGTTGDPRGVLHSHETLLYEIRSLREVHELTTADRYLGGAPVAHVAGLVYGVLMPFVLGTSTVFLDRWDPGQALELIERERATFQTGPPTLLQTLAFEPSAAWSDVSSFRLFSTGGATIAPDMVREAEHRLGCVVKRAYGSTEAPTLTATGVDDSPEARLETDGRSIGPAEIRIVDGEIQARSPEVFLGYRNPALDVEAFDEEGWFRTGDLGEIGGDGCLRVTGRLNDVIIRGGENISAREIEDLLLEHPSVADVAVVGVPDPVLGERACAFVVPRDGAIVTFEQVVGFLREREIAPQKLPERLELRPALPKTATGKVMKAALRAELTT